jgi:hypothetical protein
MFLRQKTLLRLSYLLKKKKVHYNILSKLIKSAKLWDKEKEEVEINLTQEDIKRCIKLTNDRINYLNQEKLKNEEMLRELRKQFLI